jgi:hypothetical protein
MRTGFMDLADTREKIAAWQWDSTTSGRTRFLGYRAPAEFLQPWAKAAGKTRRETKRADLSTALGNPGQSAGFPIAHRRDDGAYPVSVGKAKPLNRKPKNVPLSLE